jgi:glycosyltransferase involved in cell wall biosynthesis
VAVDGRLEPGTFGGVESFVRGLVFGLGQLTDAEDEYLVLTEEAYAASLSRLVGGNVRILPVGSRGGRSPRSTILTNRLRVERRVERLSERLRFSSRTGPPLSDGTIERHGVDIVHFTFQSGFRTTIPSVYQPHDLQHLHLPQFFTSEQLAWRDRWYTTLAKQATMIAVGSRWVKADVEEHLRMPSAKVHVVRTAPPIDVDPLIGSAEASAIRSEMGISSPYVLYPAQTWPHKNHDGLLRALARLRDHDGLAVRLVATGVQNGHFAALRGLQEDLNLSGQVTWTGFVADRNLRALYEGATAVVIPSRFEAVSFPLWEAFRIGVAAACSRVTSLPEQAGDAALLFDPDDQAGMADAIRRLWTDESLRGALIARGHEQVSGLDWARTARTYRAHYRRLAGTIASEEDLELIRQAPT